MRYVFLVIVALAAATSVARADNKTVAREAYSEGTRLFELGEYQTALASFKRAYLAYDEPSFLFNIGQCYRLLGNKSEALRSYKQYLRKVPDAPDRAKLDKIVATLEVAIENERAAKNAQPEGTIAPPAAEAASATSAPAATSASPLAPVVAPAVVAQPSAPAAPRAGDRPVYKKWWLWTIVGVVVAGAAVGTIVALTTSKPSNHTTLPDIGPRPSLVLVRF